MAESKKRYQELTWSPVRQDQFVLWRTEICHYRIEEQKSPSKPQQLRLGNSTVATLLNPPVSYINYMNCVSWCPDPENEFDLAVGQTSGRVAIVDLRKEDNLREFTVKHQRSCTSLSWNPVERRILAAGFEKHRSDYGILVWDVNVAFSAPKLHHHVHAAFSPATEASFKAGESDNAQSLEWLKQNFTFVAGMSGKALKIFDIRDSPKAEKSVSTRCVYGVCQDPKDDNRLASHGDGVISVWDMRHFDKPLAAVNTPKAVVKVAWAPNRPNVLGYLLRDQTSVGVCDIQCCTSASEDQEPIVLERDVCPPGEVAPLVSFVWNPGSECRMLTCSINNQVADCPITDRVTLNWSPISTIAWNNGRKIFRFIDSRDECYAPREDISVKMRARAAKGYGLKKELLDNMALVDESGARSVWRWLSHCKASESRDALRGIRGILSYDGVEMSSDQDHVAWTVANQTEKSASVKSYRSPARDVALSLCGWSSDLGSSSDEPQRLAALAVFSGQFDKAVRILQEAGASDRNKNAWMTLVALALSGFCGEATSLWKDMCLSQVKMLSDPYMRAMFLFLTCDTSRFSEIAEDSDMPLCDRVGFALKYLSDVALPSFLDILTTKFVEEGNLSGIMLTGFTKEGLNLFQNCIDRNGDVQSVVLFLTYSGMARSLDDPRTDLWIQSYRGLLDQWRLWTYRAQLDVQMNLHNAVESPQQQIYLSCNFCGKSIVAPTAGKGKTNPKAKITACPSCGKPLPRCAICLAYVGVNSKTLERSRNSNGLFNSWISWCQTCRHGGHAGHLLEWFSRRSECPVGGCVCRCSALDSNPRLETFQ